ncbi:glycosyltransferase family 4 protein [Desertifilum sp. FACHB-1129]|uniref:Glycoside hydrolase n=1 Tax=Desertifilum tharense IPPAS B-1220 TaxID=1781255 RepID=A0A1E5QGR2_9CYAN|nr:MULTISPECIES: glycosyltransferase family 4 protein [Desertifilum]MDA0209613.1 glycosyltransferase family 4 protein [Cyanobacteria bacterium FC1]MBD2313023.1 glycosyltransferase family 4 protein [Desertifilum sp. FACHB-1129]MBD2320931.1 glycosyltransferase family 4 protein [Desertifilum sp. FACHB-866]MBD2331060.1 glycosyltransferase family 4 protein [Desertifilum sp. FACHB-868]OEJ73875.1 glycoside hydrolase [Desertifilum tharense IPPAS B-1220]
MKILVLAWEFPPRIVGGIARHVAELYPELAKLGHEIHLLTVEFGEAPLYERVDGIAVHRVQMGHSHDFFHWVVNMNESMGRHGGKLILEEGPFDLIHAHDWLVADAAIALKQVFKIPLIATIHATEYGRYNGLHNPTHYYIDGKEKLLAHEAWRIIVCTDYMRREVERALTSPWDKIDVIYNGIRPEKKKHPTDFDRSAFRHRFADDGEKIVYYVGRMSYEKGVEVLLNAAPKVLWEMQGYAKFVIIGGGNTDHLKRQAWNLGIWDRCYFTGFLSDADLDRFQTVADCAVFPSLYEPFGIVALESFAARVPVVVSDTGGLPEVVRHTKTGVVTWTNNPDSLAWGILEVLRNPGYAQWLIDNAYEDLDRRFSWPKIAKQTETVYQRVVQERSQVDW